MVPYDPDDAKVRIEALKRRLADLEAQPKETEVNEELIGDVKEIAELEKKIKEKEDLKAGIKIEGKKEKTEEELDAEERQIIIDKNPEIRKIREMKKSKEICEFIEIAFGKKLDGRENIESLRKTALELQTERIFEKAKP
jgi:hypothetical protein